MEGIIQQYLDGLMTAEELQDFEQKLKDDPTLAGEVRALQAVELQMRAIGLDQFKDKVSLWEEAYHIEEATSERKIGWFKSPVMAVAASISIVLVAGYFLLFQHTPGTGALYNDYYQAYPDMVSTRDSGPHDEGLTAGMNAYNRGAYEEAEPLLTTYLNTHNDALGIALYIGICQMEQGKITAAINSFELSEQDPLFTQQSQWYQALAFLKAENVEMVKSSLAEISADPKHYQREQAATLLADLD